MPADVVLAMYHDQALVVAKALDFDRTVNVTLGLPVPRTSPDHGVAYDAGREGAGQRRADGRRAAQGRTARRAPWTGARACRFRRVAVPAAA